MNLRHPQPAIPTLPTCCRFRLWTLRPVSVSRLAESAARQASCSVEMPGRPRLRCAHETRQTARIRAADRLGWTDGRGPRSPGCGHRAGHRARRLVPPRADRGRRSHLCEISATGNRDVGLPGPHGTQCSEFGRHPDSVSTPAGWRYGIDATFDCQARKAVFACESGQEGRCVARPPVDRGKRNPRLERGRTAGEFVPWNPPGGARFRPGRTDRPASASRAGQSESARMRTAHVRTVFQAIPPILYRATCYGRSWRLAVGARARACRT